MGGIVVVGQYFDYESFVDSYIGVECGFVYCGENGECLWFVDKEEGNDFSFGYEWGDYCEGFVVFDFVGLWFCDNVKDDCCDGEDCGVYCDEFFGGCLCYVYFIGGDVQLELYYYE